jgi:amidase
MTDLHYLSLTELVKRLKSGELTSTAVTGHMLARISALEPQLRAYVTVTADQAMSTAARLDEDRAAGKPLGPLHGVPIALKDLLFTQGIPTSCGTKVLADWVPDEDATVVTRLKDAGAVILGKVKLTEGAFSVHHPEVVRPLNPWNAEHWTGVSSSGSGVAVAAGLAFGALGSDTGGSIRFPSASCGVVGIKPTYGRVSRHGAFPLADSLDHIGPMARTVEDAARMLGVVSGQDDKDPTSLAAPVPNYSAGLDQRLSGLKVGVDWRYVETDVEESVVATVRSALQVLADLGAVVTEVTLPPCETLIEQWGVTTGVECALAHAEYYPDRKDDYGPVLAGLIELGRATSGMDYARLERIRERFRADLSVLLEGIDVLIAPCMLAPPLPLAVMDQTTGDDDAVRQFITFTAPFDYSGHPTITLPAGLGDDGLPRAFQLIGRHLGEPTLVHAGFAYEQAMGLDLRPVA